MVRSWWHIIKICQKREPQPGVNFVSKFVIFWILAANIVKSKHGQRFFHAQIIFAFNFQYKNIIFVINYNLIKILTTSICVTNVFNTFCIRRPLQCIGHRLMAKINWNCLEMWTTGFIIFIEILKLFYNQDVSRGC